MIEAVADQGSVDRHSLAVGQRTVAVYEREGRVGVEGSHATLEELRRPDIVGVEEGEILARRIPCAVVARRCRPAVYLLDQPHARAVFPDDRECAVSRAVVDANDFEILERLPDNAIEGAGDSRGRIVRRDDYRNARHFGWTRTKALATGYTSSARLLNGPRLRCRGYPCPRKRETHGGVSLR